MTTAAPNPVSLADRIAATALVNGPFALSDGRRLSSYFDEYLLAGDPQLLTETARAMAGHLPADTDVLAGVELGGIPLTVALSTATGLPAAFVRRRPKEYGSLRQFEGTEIQGRRVVLVDDVIRSGTSLLTAARRLRIAGAKVTDVLCVLERPLGGQVLLAEHHLTLHPLLTEANFPAAKGGEQA
ncbi:orotate phosphoribosyltransferase [Streptomyces sp. A 4/2]|uniref:orotate phosphoribosyltransferase n=1 Tax=Streptomyces sp. A 4/2 TaxID=2934314 RepID=UPI00202436F1|nr:phosphoribosyltransferase family protein [Streptomyces sp. A 4/2]